MTNLTPDVIYLSIQEDTLQNTDTFNYPVLFLKIGKGAVMNVYPSEQFQIKSLVLKRLLPDYIVMKKKMPQCSLSL